MDGCKKCAIVFQSVVASCEFINCKSVQMQVDQSNHTIDYITAGHNVLYNCKLYFLAAMKQAAYFFVVITKSGKKFKNPCKFLFVITPLFGLAKFCH